MKLSTPFIIGARLLPALQIGDAVLSLDTGFDAWTEDNRERARFIVDLPDGTEYVDEELRSGVGGFRGYVQQFETFLCFLDYASTGNDPDADAAPMFPPHVLAWAQDCADDIACARMNITDDAGNALSTLIED